MPQYVGSRIPGFERQVPRLATSDFPLLLVVHREIQGNALVRTAFDHLALAVANALGWALLCTVVCPRQRQVSRRSTC